MTICPHCGGYVFIFGVLALKCADCIDCDDEPIKCGKEPIYNPHAKEMQCLSVKK